MMVLPTTPRVKDWTMRTASIKATTRSEHRGINQWTNTKIEIYIGTELNITCQVRFVNDKATLIRNHKKKLFKKMKNIILSFTSPSKGKIFNLNKFNLIIMESKVQIYLNSERLTSLTPGSSLNFCDLVSYTSASWQKTNSNNGNSSRSYSPWQHNYVKNKNSHALHNYQVYNKGKNYTLRKRTVREHGGSRCDIVDNNGIPILK